MIARGGVWWASLGEPRGSGPGFPRPVVVIQADAFNASRLSTVIVVALTSNLRLAAAPGNVLLERAESGLPKDSVANVAQVLTIDRELLAEHLADLRPELQAEIDSGLRLAMAL